MNNEWQKNKIEDMNSQKIIEATNKVFFETDPLDLKSWDKNEYEEESKRLLEQIEWSLKTSKFVHFEDINSLMINMFESISWKKSSFILSALKNVLLSEGVSIEAV